VMSLVTLTNGQAIIKFGQFNNEETQDNNSSQHLTPDLEHYPFVELKMGLLR